MNKPWRKSTEEFITFMKRVYRFFLSVVCLSGLGCEVPPTSSPSVSSEISRLKITDLAPSKNPIVEIQCGFAVVAYRLSSEQAQSVPKTLSMLNIKKTTFSDSEAFESNGLWVAAGTFEQTAEVVDALNKLGAKQLGTKQLFMFQNYPGEITGFSVEPGRTLFYFGAGKTPIAKQVSGGRLSLMLWARPDTPQRGFASVRIEPFFQPGVFLKGGGGNALFENLSFREGRLLTTMAEGDFLVLTVPKEEELSIFSRFFLPAHFQESARLLYLIICQKAGE